MRSEITNYSFKPGLPQEFEIKDLAQLYQAHTTELTSPHRTGFYHILWFKRGTPTHLVDFQPMAIKEGTLLFLPKDTVQQFDVAGGFDGKALLFTDSFFSKSDQDAKFLSETILFNDLYAVARIQVNHQHQRLIQLLEDMEHEVGLDQDGFQWDILRNQLHNFLMLAERERRKQGFIEVKKGIDLDIVVEFKKLLEKVFKHDKRVRNFAAQLHITEKRLNLATTKVLGQTPKQMIDHRVMLEAKRLLAHTNESIKHIGFELGFEEPTNFIKYFKRHQNTTPYGFRARLLS